jgi:hypothetical protein
LEDDDKRIKIRPLALPLVLSGVCGQWCDIVWSMPDLWTKIDIARRGKKLELFKCWLARTGKRPISVKLSFSPWNRPCTAWKFLDALAEHSAQSADVYICIPRWTVEGEVQLEGSFPALRRLTIELPDHGINKQFNDCDWEPDTETLADFEDAPLLGEVKLIGWYDRMEILLPWSKLTTISLEYNTAKLPPVPRGTTWQYSFSGPS